MQAKKPFKLLYEKSQKPKLLDLNLKLSEIIFIARPLFNISDEIDLRLKIKGEEHSTETTLEELGLNGGEVLELVQIRLAVSQHLITTLYLCIKDNDEISDMHTWTAFLSDGLSDIARSFCASQGLNPDLYTLVIDDQPVAGDLKLQDINPGEVILVLEKMITKIGNESQKNPGQAEEREFSFIISGEELKYETQVDWLLNVKQLKEMIAKELEFPTSTLQRWYVGKKELDDHTPLKNQVASTACIIIEQLFPIAFNITSNNKKEEKILHVSLFHLIKSLKVSIESSILIRSENQIWSLNGSDELKDDQSLLSYTGKTEGFTVYIKDSAEAAKRPLSEIKKNFSFKYENKQVIKRLSINENIETLIQKLPKSFDLPENTQISLHYKNKVMDPWKSLDDYMENNGESIIVKIKEIKESEIDKRLITVIYEKMEQEFPINNKLSVKDLKDKVCASFQITTPYLYSLSFESKILKLSQILEEIENFGEDAILELEPIVEIKLSNQANLPLLKTEMFVNPLTTIANLKKSIIAQNIEKYTLFFNQDPLQEDQPLSRYKIDENEILITIKIKVILNKIPENHQYIINIALNECFDDLKKNLEEQCRVNSELQVWRHAKQKIQDQSDWSTFLANSSSEKSITIEFFECILPHQHDMCLEIFHNGSRTLEKLKLDITEQIAILKTIVASALSLPSTAIQIWKWKSEELNDDEPLAIQCDLRDKQNSTVQIEIPRIKQVRFIIDSIVQIFRVDIDKTVAELKNEFFNSNYTSIKPESQLWSLNNETKELSNTLPLELQLKDLESSLIHISMRTCRINLMLWNNETNTKKQLSFDEDPETPVRVLKGKAALGLGIDASLQFWSVNSTPMEDHVPLKNYFQNNLRMISIGVFVLKEFNLIPPDQGSVLSMKLHLLMPISQVKKEIVKQANNLLPESLTLKAFNDTLQDDKCLNDYARLWSKSQKPVISVISIKKYPTFIITYRDKTANFFWDSQKTLLEIKEAVKQKFGIERYDIELLEGDRQLDDNEIESSYQNAKDKVLTCIQLKKVILNCRDRPEATLTVASYTTIGDLKKTIQTQCRFEEAFNLLMNGTTPIPDDTVIDDINPYSPLFKFTMQVAQGLNNHVQNDKDPSNQIQVPQEEKEPEDIAVPNRPKTDASIQRSMSSSFRKTVTVVLLDGEKKLYTCNQELATIGHLQKKLERFEDIDVSHQLLLLVKNDKWERRLTEPDHKLEDFATEEEGGVSSYILLKRLRKFCTIYGIEGQLQTFEGISGALVKDQKKMFGMQFNDPNSNLVWIIGPINNSTVLEDNKSIESYGIRGYDETNPIRIFRQITVTVCWCEKSETLEDLPTYESIGALKARLSKKLNVLPKDQLWSYNDQELEDDKIIEKYFLPNQNPDPSLNVNAYAIDLIIRNDLEYFGWTCKSEINLNAFKEFFIESGKELNRIIDSVAFNKAESSLLFRNQLLGLFFGTLKKHCMWEDLIRKIKQHTFENKKIIVWENNSGSSLKSTFNTQFLLYYFLNSGTPELNIEILKLMKMHFPVPLAINSWTNRFFIESMKILNEVYWIFQKSFVITSFGLGGAEKTICGKTELINTLLFCGFVKSSERNQICQGCPEIVFDLYKNDKFSINLIDIPAGTPENIRNKIIENSNMLIIHSLGDKKETVKYLETIKVPTIVFHRDIPEAFSHLGPYMEQLSNNLKSAFDTLKFEIDLPKLTIRENSLELNHISAKVHEFILTCYQKTDDREFYKFFEFFEDHNQNMNAILDKITENSTRLVQAISVFDQLKKLERTELPVAVKKQQELELRQRFEKTLLAPAINQLIELLIASEQCPNQKYSENPGLFLDKLQDYLRIMKSKQSQDFFKLYEFKSQLISSLSVNQTQVITRFFQYWETIKKQDTHYNSLSLDKSSTKEQICSFIEDCIEIFEQKITPNIFSIELFWRELIYFSDLQPDHKIIDRKTQQESHLSDFLVNLKRENILNGLPFEIIDGDLLYMPKEFLKSVFKGFNDRVAIISVLGPQSSGKSTLLNFLFGCNFVTSSGRCTKGIYGTYFKLSNFSTCDGILVLDTEGLFGLLNKKEEQNRDKFDRKLVLFCLAMSDFVLINFKGDIDKTLTDVLMVCRDSLTKLQQGNVEAPEMFLILNQNTQTDINTQLQDINRMTGLGFSQQNVAVLPLAFETETHSNPAIQKVMDPLVKKKPKNEFAEQTRILAQKIFDKIALNFKQKTLQSTMDRMDHLWELLNKFQDLLRHTTMQDKSREKEIKDWISLQVDEALRNKLSNMNEDKFNQEEKILKKVFEDKFKENTHYRLYNDMEMILLVHLKRVRTELLHELSTQAHQKKIKTYDLEGVKALREEARKVKNQGNITETEKSKRFEEVWNTIVTNFKESYDRKQESENLLQIVRDNCKTCLMTYIGGLPDTKFPQDIDISFDEYSKTLLRLVEGFYIMDKAFEYTKQAPALIFKGGKSDISFTYLDLRRYFKEVEVEEFIGFPKSKLCNLLNIPKITKDLFETTDLKNQEAHVKIGLLEKLKKELMRCGISIPIDLLERYLIYHQESRFGRWLFSDFNFDHTVCGFFKQENFYYENEYDLIKPSNIRSKVQDHICFKATAKNLFEYILRSCIHWDKISNKLKSELSRLYREIRRSEIAYQIQKDLEKINLQFPTINERLFSMCYDWEDDKPDKCEIAEDIVVLKPSSLPIYSKDMLKDGFKYLNQAVLEENLMTLPYEKNFQYLALARWSGKKRVVKNEFTDVYWLHSYAKEENRELFQNTIENTNLVQFIYKEFRLKPLLVKIFLNCISQIKQFDSWNYSQLYQTVTRETNDLIGLANSDLQQVSYRLEFNLVGQIHLAVAHLIWKFFEEKYWAKITEPLMTLQGRKEQQRRYFNAMASSDQIYMNAAEAEKMKQYLETHIADTISNVKKEIIKSAAIKFQKQTMRSQVQEEIDSNHFSQHSNADGNDIYHYIINPYEVLLKAYQKKIAGYLNGIRTDLGQKKAELESLLQDFLSRIISVQQILASYEEDHWSIDKIIEFKQYAAQGNEVLFNKYESELGSYYYRVVLAILKGGNHKLLSEYEIDEHTKIALRNSNLFSGHSFADSRFDGIFNFLEQQEVKVTNALVFIKSLNKQVAQLIKSSFQSIEITDDNIKEFQDKINIFVCKQKCPCCDRICGVEDPAHRYHQCLYGHQIRGMGGVMRENKEASVARCEDIEDFDVMQFNGQVMTWMEFKEIMKAQVNNPWIYDDIETTRKDLRIKERFQLAWTLIGKRICTEKYRDSGMKYVSYNQITIANQKLTGSKTKNYIFMIDSSGSMCADNKWKDLQSSLKDTLGNISSFSQDNKVTIINFSSKVKLDCTNESPNSVDVDKLTFQGEGTDFEAAFTTALNHIKTIKVNDIVLIFMTDGESKYPRNAIANMKNYLSDPTFTRLKIRFSFDSIGFQCRSDFLTKVGNEFGGTPYFADNGEQLTQAFMEILNKENINNL